MAVHKRGRIWWYSFEFEGRRVQKSSGFTNKKRAIDAQSVRRTKLLERRAGLSEVKLAPKFEEHVGKFLEWSKQQHRPKTRELDGTNCDMLLRFFRGCWLDEITSGMVEDFKLARAGRGTPEREGWEYRFACNGQPRSDYAEKAIPSRGEMRLWIVQPHKRS